MWLMPAPHVLVRSLRSFQPTELLHVLSKPHEYGLRPGVWFLIRTSAELDASPQVLLCSRFGLSQAGLDKWGA